MCFLHKEFDYLATEELGGHGDAAPLPQKPMESIHLSLPPGKPLPVQDTKVQNRGILRTCNELYEEVSVHLYEKEVLTFHIWPTALSFDWLPISTSGNAKWDLTFEDLANGSFRFLPYKRLRGIEIEIEAPERKESGELILLWTKVRDLVDLLSQVDELPNIEIRLYETNMTYAKWSKKGKLQKSIPIDRDDSDTDWYDPDSKVVLMPFCRLSNVRKASIRCPEGFNPGNFVLGNIEWVMEQKEAFGTIKTGHLWDDDSIQEDLELTQFLFDDALDHLPGRTAGFMRVERFGRWFDQDPTCEKSQYLEDWARICKSDGMVRCHNQPLRLCHRFNRLLHLNPGSVGMQMVRHQLHIPENWRVNTYSAFDVGDFREYLESTDLCRKNDLGFPTEPTHLKETIASRIEWHDYWRKCGIPPLDDIYKEIEHLMSLAGSVSELKLMQMKNLKRWSREVWKEAMNHAKEKKKDKEKHKEKSLKKERVDLLGYPRHPPPPTAVTV